MKRMSSRFSVGVHDEERDTEMRSGSFVAVKRSRRRHPGTRARVHRQGDAAHTPLDSITSSGRTMLDTDNSSEFIAGQQIRMFVGSCMSDRN